MNFKEAFNNDCKKITASDELRNRTLMAATTSSKEDKVMKKTVKTRRNTFHLNVPAICTALAVAVIAVIVIAFNAINNNSNIKTTAAFKVYAGENRSEITKKGISIDKYDDTAFNSSLSVSFSDLSRTSTLLFDLNIQVEDDNIKNITLSSSDENVNIFLKAEVPDEVKNNDYKIPEHYFTDKTYYPHVCTDKETGEKYLFANLRQEYSASYDDFQHVYLACTLPNINNINSTLTITVEYNDGTVVSKNYSATAYLSEYYLFIYEMK